MSVLCYDISSSGITGALLNSSLEPLRLRETRWTPAPALSLEMICGQFKGLTRELTLGNASDPVAAISIGSFLHSSILLDGAGLPLSSVFTWLGTWGEEGVKHVRSRIGNTFHERTGCHYHPMFPVFKLAALHLSSDGLLSKVARIVSIKSFLLHMLTGNWVEDHGMASATGLYNVMKGQWDSEILNAAGIKETQLAPVYTCTEVIGRVTSEAVRQFGLPDNIAVVNGSGDGFLASIGSGCESSHRISVTFGTSAAARQTLRRAVLESSSGTFCYMAADGVYLLGCAGNNGGNVVDWGRSIFGNLKQDNIAADIPIFIPLLHGERSPDWNPHLTGSWHGLTARHTAADLRRSILEGVVFNLVHFVEIVQSTSGAKASDIILSGNGFLEPLAAPILATIVDPCVRMPEQPGLASLRGSGLCALRAFGVPDPPLKSERVSPMVDSEVRERYRRYRSLRYHL